jgi:hypothetical protein
MDENPGKIAEIIDKRLHGNYDMKSINLVAKVAMRCVQAEPSFRPSASEVVVELKNAMKHEDKASISISETNDLLAGPIYLSVDSNEGKVMEWSVGSSEPKEMEWSDNSANISKVGR